MSTDRSAMTIEAAVSRREDRSESLSLHRLVRLCDATLERNLKRPQLEGSQLFDASRISNRQAEALRYIVAQLCHIEAAGPRNLAQVARVVPIREVQACFAAQIHDEIAHSMLLFDWLSKSGEAIPMHPAASFGCWAGEVVQNSPWLGVANVTLLIEYFASSFLEALSERTEEPYLLAILSHVQKDESRHKAIAVEALVALREQGLHRRALVRALGPLVNAGTLSYFRFAFGVLLEQQAAILDLELTRIFERALDEAHAAQAHAFSR